MVVGPVGVYPDPDQTFKKKPDPDTWSEKKPGPDPTKKI